jgi:hypothetical protein
MIKGHASSVNGMIDGGATQVVGHDENALRVVVDLSRGTGQLNVFVLVNPDEQGLCEAYSTDIEEVWWHHLYRDDDVDSVERRRKAWRAVLKTSVDRLQMPEDCRGELEPGPHGCKRRRSA